MDRYTIKYAVFIFTIAFVLFLPGCDLRNSIRVGFSGQLTGPNANMGVSGRDGARLAIDEINASGGITRKKIELLVSDDKGTVEGARSADRKLIDAGVVAIIGHMTSSQTMAALPVVEKAGMILLSPTTSTPALTGKVDHFFRIISDTVSEAQLLARHVVHWAGIERMAAIYDNDNAAYTNAYLTAFRNEFEKQGGQMVGQIGYSSSERPVFGPVVAKLREVDPQGLLVITSAYDGGLITQQPRRLGWKTHLFGSGWTKSSLLIETGGRAVEGMAFVHYHDQNSSAPRYLKFRQSYMARFKQEPTFMAANTYEAIQVLAAALKHTGGRSEGLGAALPGIGIEGLMGSVFLDQYGDGVRASYLVVVQDGKFVMKEQVDR